MLASLAALAAGALLTLAFAPFHVYLLAPLAAAALLWLWHDVSPRRACWLGFVFGLGHFGSGIYWVTISLHVYGNAPLAFAILMTSLLVVYLSLYPALAGLLLNRFSPASGSAAVAWLLVAPALWTLLEWLRSWLLSGFPWLSLGYSQSDSWLANLAPITGVFGLSWAVMLSAGCLLLALRAALAVPRRPVRFGLSLLGLVVIWAGSLALGAVTWTTPSGPPLRLSLVQGNIDQLEKFRPDVSEQTLRLYTEQSLAVANTSDVIIWPETAIPVFYSELDPAFLNALNEHAVASRTDYITGVPAGNWRDGEYYNGVVSFGPSSEQRFYYKHRLLPFGEYLPLRFLFNLFHSLVDIPMADFTAGQAYQVPLIAGGQPAGVSICFEAVFGNDIRRALPEASWLINVSNDGWFGDSTAPHQHLQITRLRALETARPLARATNTGVTALIDYNGQILDQIDQFRVAVLQGELQPRQGSTPYVALGDWPIVGLSALLLIVSLGWRPAQVSA